jgi:hypothetical protein
MTELSEAAFTRATRTVRTRCEAIPAVCADCTEVLEADGDELACRSCDRRWAADELTPCPRPAIAHVVDEDGHQDVLCASHAALWRRLAARLGADPATREIAAPARGGAS